ncbi:MAG: hypothetical protein K2Q20_09175 [Phycisphaerales bacterium]|nr:hypothetical protein [Phycisphaerales bacterium]
MNADRLDAEALSALEALRGLRDWRVIPSILETVSHQRAPVRSCGASVIAELTSFIPAAALPGFDSTLRDSTYQSWAWSHVQAEWVSAQDWPPGVWAIFSMHHNGFVREIAVRRLASSADLELALPFLLLRINDWVGVVREVAKGVVERLIGTGEAAPWVPALGMLDQLGTRSRADHTWLSTAVTALFLRPGSAAALMRATGSDDRRVARWAFRTALQGPAADRLTFVRIAFESDDPVSRLRAASAVRAWIDVPDRDRWLERMASDRFMPIRREALYAAVDGPPESRRAFLRARLMDHHPSMRHAARFYLREGAGEDALDFRRFYIDAIGAASPGERAVAIAGLGECGIPADAEILTPLVGDVRASIAAAAVRAVSALDRERRADWLVELLRDDRPAVAWEAKRGLERCAHSADVESLRRVFHRAPGERSRLYALQILLRRSPYDAVVDAIAAAASESPVFERAAAEFWRRVMYASSPHGPSEAQRAAARSAIAALPRPLATDMQRHVDVLMRFVMN